MLFGPLSPSCFLGFDTGRALINTTPKKPDLAAVHPWRANAALEPLAVERLTSHAQHLVQDVGAKACGGVTLPLPFRLKPNGRRTVRRVPVPTGRPLSVPERLKTSKRRNKNLREFPLSKLGKGGPLTSRQSPCGGAASNVPKNGTNRPTNRRPPKGVTRSWVSQH